MPNVRRTEQEKSKLRMRVLREHSKNPTLGCRAIGRNVGVSHQFVSITLKAAGCSVPRKRKDPGATGPEFKVYIRGDQMNKLDGVVRAHPKFKNIHEAARFIVDQWLAKPQYDS